MGALIHDHVCCPKFAQEDTIQRCDTCWSLWWDYWEAVDEGRE